MRAVVFREGPKFIGVLIDHDIVVQAGSIREMMRRMELTIDLEMEECAGDLDRIAPAPIAFQDLLDEPTTTLFYRGSRVDYYMVPR